MAGPASRQEFKDYIMGRLGYPVIDIEVDDSQLEDRIDDALQKFRDYHFDGTDHCYYKIQVTADDIANKYFTLPDDLVGVTRIFKLNVLGNLGSIFNLRYQIHLNDLFNLSAAEITPYVMAMRHIETLQEIFQGETPIRFNRMNNKLYCDFEWNSSVSVGSWIIAEGYRTVDPEVYTAVWNDQWLKKYATALVKQQWGMNLSKFSSMVLPGGTNVDGVRILQEANTELDQLDHEVISSYSLPVFDMMN